MPYLFAYGTLKSGHANHAYFIDRLPIGTRNVGNLVLYQHKVYDYPIAVRTPDSHLAIKGEVFELASSEFSRIRRMESSVGFILHNSTVYLPRLGLIQVTLSIMPQTRVGRMGKRIPTPSTGLIEWKEGTYDGR